jgi:hypothetical protein
MRAAILTTSVKAKILTEEIKRPPLFMRLVFVAIIIGINVAMFINIFQHPIWIYLIANFVAIWLFGRISNRYASFKAS